MLILQDKKAVILDKKKCFERFYRENYEQFFHFAYRYLNDEEACRDIVSNAFEYAWSNYEREDVPDWKLFLLSYIRHKSLDYIRHVQVHNRFVRARLQMDEDFTDADLLEREERIAQISHYLGKLPPPYSSHLSGVLHQRAQVQGSGRGTRYYRPCSKETYHEGIEIPT